MNTDILISNITNPTLLFFLLGIVASVVKSDLEIPQPSIKFISLYLLFSIGFKGGQELAHSGINQEIMLSMLFALVISALIPFYLFYLALPKFGAANAGAVAAAYGSVSAVTFVSAANFLDASQITYGGHMVAVMAFMEAPAIIVGVSLMKRYQKQSTQKQESLGSVVVHSFTNGSVLMIVGSLIIGLISDAKQAEGIKPFTNDIFKGFLAIFLLEMGMITAKRIKGCFSYGKASVLIALLIPLINGVLVAYTSQWVTTDIGNRFMFAILAASASYIAVPATMRLAAPDADPGLYIPMALGVTFPLNITLGMPLYLIVAQST